MAEHDLPGLLLAEGQAIVPVLRLARSRGVQPGLVNRVLVRLVQRPDMVTPTGDPLTPREIEALRLIAQGATNREVAEALVVTEWTVKGHMTNILRKLGAATRTEAAVKARELGLD